LRLLWLAACLLLSGMCLWKSVPQEPVAPSLQTTESAASVQLAAEADRPRYVTEDIERLRVGDSVLAMDPATGEVRQHRVVDHFQRTAYELRVLEVIGQDGTGQRIETTDEHPFWVVAKGGFVPAGELEIGDEFLGPVGEIQILTGTRVEQHPEGVPVFNFEVEDAHTYFVLGEDLQGDPLLVHNATARQCGKIGEKGVKGWLKRNGYTNIRSIQNRSGHGIDIVAERNGRYYFFEVKSSQTRFAPSLSQAQANGQNFVETRLRAAMRRGRFWRTSDSHISDDARQIYRDIYIDGKPYHGRVIELTNIGQGGMTDINLLPWW
jgi:Holliday junction resolvase-like predicted endonuclease